MKASYDHLCLTVGDLDRSIAFYGKFFGLKVARRDAEVHRGEMVDTSTGIRGAELLAAFLTDGRMVLELIQFTRERGDQARSAPANQVGAPHLGFVVEDVREAWRQWSADGAAFLHAPVLTPRGKWSVKMLDPDGVPIELREGNAIPAETLAAVVAP